MTAQYAFFWGCQIPGRLPFMEKSIRMVLDQLNVKYKDIPGFTCCPEKSLIKNLSEMHWLVTAARNLAVAEKEGLNIISACNGCYGTLRAAATKMKDDPKLKAEVNEILAKAGLNYKGKVDIKHLIEFLYDDVGPAKIKQNIVTPLTGLKIAVHHGCHMLRPSTAIHFDDPLKPSKFDVLVETLGAYSVDYHTKMMCCGGALSHVGEGEESVAMTRKKLLELQKIEVDAMTLACPACFMQYDQKQYLVQRQGEKIHVPVLTIAELLGLAFGMDPKELGLSGHRVDLEPFFKSWEKRKDDMETVRRHLELQTVRNCYECGACVSDCPVAEISSFFNPNQLIGELLDGKIEELLTSKDIWKCVECHTCYEMCPQKFGMEKVFSTLKHMAMERGLMPQSIKAGVDTFLKTGVLANKDARARKKLGLDELPDNGGEELAKLLEEIDYHHKA